MAQSTELRAQSQEKTKDKSKEERETLFLPFYPPTPQMGGFIHYPLTNTINAKRETRNIILPFAFCLLL
jgi:hypothetical protein